MSTLKRRYESRKKKPLKICPMCGEKLIKEKLNHLIMFLVCYNCNYIPIVVDWYHILKPKRIKLKEKTNEPI